MTPPISKKIGFLRSLARPVDFGIELEKKPILGSHKTWRGVVLGILVGILIVWLQTLLYNNFPFFQKVSLVNYDKINVFLFGFLISGGAIFGDILFSFLKRRFNLKPGQSWLPFDQIDYVIGAFLLLDPFFRIPLAVWLALLIATFPLHIIVTYLGYRLKICENKF